MNVPPMLPQVVATPRGDVPSRPSDRPGQPDGHLDGLPDGFADLLAAGTPTTAEPPTMSARAAHDAGGVATLSPAPTAEPPTMSGRAAQHAGVTASDEAEPAGEEVESATGVLPLSVVTAFGSVAVDPFVPSVAARAAVEKVGGLEVNTPDVAAARPGLAAGGPNLSVAAVEGTALPGSPLTTPVTVGVLAVAGVPGESVATGAAVAPAVTEATAGSAGVPTAPTGLTTTPEPPAAPAQPATPAQPAEPPTMVGPAAQDVGVTGPKDPADPPAMQAPMPGTPYPAASTSAPGAASTDVSTTATATTTAPATAPVTGSAAVPGLPIHDSRGSDTGSGSGRQSSSRGRPGQPVEGAAPATAGAATAGVGAGAGVANPTFALRTADGGSTSAITGQVFPEVARLITRGDGTQRLTVKLNPEALGEVRVVLTVRNGDVHVRMAGNDAAHQALLNGAPELQRLLERAGAGSSQIVVGDGSAATHSMDRGSSQGQQHRDSSHLFGAQDGMPNDAGRHPQNHRTAGTRDGSTSATDGAAGGTRPRSSTDPAAGIGGVTHTRLAGVDVTM